MVCVGGGGGGGGGGGELRLGSDHYKSDDLLLVNCYFCDDLLPER